MEKEPIVLNNYGVILRQLTHDKIEMVRQWRNDPKIRQYMEFREEITSEMQERWFQRISTSGRDFYFIIEVDEREIGLINIRDIDYNQKQGEPGIFIWDDDFLNSDFSFRSSLCLLDYVFDTLDLDKTISHVLKDNKRAIDFTLFWGYELSPGQDTINNQEYVLFKETYKRKRYKIAKLFH